MVSLQLYTRVALFLVSVLLVQGDDGSCLNSALDEDRRDMRRFASVEGGNRWFQTPMPKHNEDPPVTSVKEAPPISQKTAYNFNALLQLQDSFRQTFLGVGAMLTQSSAYTLLQLKERNCKLYWKTLLELFGCELDDSHACLNVVSLPISANHFIVETSYFTMDDVVGDWSLEKVSSSVKKHLGYQMQVILDIGRIKNDVKILAVPFSAPTWMKDGTTRNKEWETGHLASAMVNTYATMIAKILQKLSHIGINVYGLSLQYNAILPDQSTINGEQRSSHPAMAMDPSTSVLFAAALKTHLTTAGMDHIVLIGHDSTWATARMAASMLALDVTSSRNLGAVGFHCDAGNPSEMSDIHDQYPNEAIYVTFCTGHGVSNFREHVPSFAQNLYSGAVNNWASVVMHGPLVLDSHSGPRIAGSSTNARGLISIDIPSSTHGDVTITKNEEYYGLLHLSKGVQKDARVVATDFAGESIHCITSTVFRNPDSSYALMLANFCEGEQWISINIDTPKTRETGLHISTFLPEGLSTVVLGKGFEEQRTADNDRSGKDGHTKGDDKNSSGSSGSSGSSWFTVFKLIAYLFLAVVTFFALKTLLFMCRRRVDAMRSSGSLATPMMSTQADPSFISVDFDTESAEEPRSLLELFQVAPTPSDDGYTKMDSGT